MFASMSDFLRSKIVAYDSLVKKRTSGNNLVCIKLVLYMHNKLLGVLCICIYP